MCPPRRTRREGKKDTIVRFTRLPSFLLHRACTAAPCIYLVLPSFLPSRPLPPRIWLPISPSTKTRGAGGTSSARKLAICLADEKRSDRHASETNQCPWIAGCWCGDLRGPNEERTFLSFLICERLNGSRHEAHLVFLERKINSMAFKALFGTWSE